ncbi:TRAP transporter large permease [Aquabacterium humicola]|uniref:TRAP transporter large permease n=1 Tax=Aquabacterium humicola TaxID=3237377 RepID=UPI002542E0E2|nr:TRAP transporter large permease subunit [Rubrivivax pictus]
MNHGLAALMFLSMAGALMLGFPVGLTLIVHGFAFTLLGAALDLFPLAMAQAHMLRVYGLLFSEVLLAIPFFTLMGLVLERSGIAEQMLQAVSTLLQGARGGLAMAVIIVGTVLAATTGVVQASIIPMGLIALPAMLRAGYAPGLAAGSIAAAGTLAQLIPPSLVLIVIADATGVPIFRMYEKALVPGLFLAGLYLAYIAVLTRLRPGAAPSGAGAPSWRSVLAALRSLAPPALIVAATIGSVLAGVATPTESGGFGATASLALAASRRRLDLAALRSIVDGTTLISCSALFVMIGALFFTLPFNAMDGKVWVGEVFSHLPGGPTGFLVAATLLVFVLAFFLDFFEIAFLALPLLVPAAVALGIDAAWFGVLVCIALQTSFMHPPFGVALYTLRSVAPASLESRHLYRGALPFIAMQLLAAALVIGFPELAVDLGARRPPPLPDDQVEQILSDFLAAPASAPGGPPRP